MATSGRIHGCTISRTESGLRAVVSARRAEDVQNCYQAVAASCVLERCHRVLVVGHSISDAFVHLAGRDALRSLALAGVPADFRLALVAATPDLIAIYDTAVLEAGRLGFAARRFTSEDDALCWLAS